MIQNRFHVVGEFGDMSKPNMAPEPLSVWKARKSWWIVSSASCPRMNC